MKTIIEATFKPADEIELEAFGITSGVDGARPVMLFREKGGEATLPVWLSPLDAGIALTVAQPHSVMLSPHDVTLDLLDKLGIKLAACHFREVKGHHQYVELIFTGSRKVKSMKVRADHAISFCLQSGVRFYCTRSYLEECRQVDAEISKMPPPKFGADGKRHRPTYMN